MTARALRPSSPGSIIVGTVGLVAGTASAHVILDAPNGGETLTAGAAFTIVWHVDIAHETQNWDLWYSTEGPSGPWSPIALDLEAGDTSGGAVHELDWEVPDLADDTVWVRVRQDNTGNDWDDVSDGPFSVAAACPWDLDVDGAVTTADLLALVAAWGAAGGPADFDGDGVSTTDLLELLGHWGPCP